MQNYVNGDGTVSSVSWIVATLVHTLLRFTFNNHSAPFVAVLPSTKKNKLFCSMKSAFTHQACFPSARRFSYTLRLNVVLKSSHWIKCEHIARRFSIRTLLSKPQLKSRSSENLNTACLNGKCKCYQYVVFLMKHFLYSVYSERLLKTNFIDNFFFQFSSLMVAFCYVWAKCNKMCCLESSRVSSRFLMCFGTSA